MEAIRLFLTATNQPEPSRQATLLWLLATGVGRPESLMTTLKAMAMQSRGQWRVKLLQLHSMLKDGIRLPNALTSIPGIVPDQTRAAIRVAQSAGSLNSVLWDEARRLSGRDLSRQSMPSRSVAGTLFAVFVTALVLNFVLSFMIIWIVPKLRAIADSFAVETPPVTAAMFSICEFVARYWYLTIVPMTGCLLAGCVYSQIAHARFLIVGDNFFYRMFPRLRLPEALRSLSVAVAAEVNLAEALLQFSSEFRIGRSRRLFMTVADAVSNGEDCWDAMLRLRLIRAKEHAFLRTAQATGHLDWGLMHLSRDLVSRRARLQARLSQTLQPAIHLAAGLAVAFGGIAFFSWYARLTEAVANVP